MTEKHLPDVVKNLQRTVPEGREQWVAFVTMHGENTLDPARHSHAFLQMFLTQFHTAQCMQASPRSLPAALGSTDLGSSTQKLKRPKPIPDRRRESEVLISKMVASRLVEEVKELQRKSPEARQHWIQYVDLLGERAFDPSKHSIDFLKGFLFHYQSEEDSETQHIKDLVRASRKTSQSWKTMWRKYCQMHGGGKLDPSRHGAEFHAAFTDFVAASAMSTLGDASHGSPSKDVAKLENHVAKYCQMHGGGKLDPSRHGAEFHAAFTDFVAASAMSTLGDASHGSPVPRYHTGAGAAPSARTHAVVPVGADARICQLAQRVKEYQKQGLEEGVMWDTFCDGTASGVKDPFCHHAASLQRFLSEIERPSALMKPAMSVGGTVSASNKNSGSAALTDRWKTGSGHLMSWGTARDDTWHSAADQPWTVAVAHREPEDQAETQLVSKIQAFGQRDDGTSEWVTYCDMKTGVVRDPERLEVATLQCFAADYGTD
eukprot:CAMPEP_0194549964 /NCGR_PEP_ID=MMETSP0253-20130528/95474_1 /TAXON_ID=2966 /ORGANISM="Noctiluca scintillans" /LENGTH=487 /DNA_ID=CAMNT_0039397399 /DNA_START=18 /DNA_END=1479 /DNA_ORIENTATION=-